MKVEVGKVYKVSFDDCCVQGSFISTLKKIEKYSDGDLMDGGTGYYNLEFVNGVKIEGHALDLKEVSQKDQPYLIDLEEIGNRCYNPEYGDSRICECGHTYYRHFDTYENMSPCGCKYCGCHTFKEREGGE